MVRLTSRWSTVPGRSGVVGTVVLVAVAALALAGLLQLRTDTSPESFLPAGDQTLLAMQDAASSFGADPVVVLLESAQPRELFEPDPLDGLLGLEGRLSALPDVAAVYGPATVLNQIAGAAQNLVATLSGRRDAVRQEAARDATAAGGSPAQVTAAGDAAVSIFDQRYAALLVRGLPAGLPTLSNPKFAATVIFDETGNPRPQWQFVVPSPQSVTVLVRPREGLDQAGTEALVVGVRAAVQGSGLELARVTVTGAPAVAAALGAQVRQEIFVLGGLAIGAIALCYQLAPWHGRRYRLLPSAATLCATALVLAGFGWLDRPLSLGVVAFLPILIGIGSDFPAYLMRHTNRRRVLAAAVASAAGFASLAVSPLPFVRDLGLALAAGVVMAVSVALVFRRFLVGEEPPEPAPADPPTRLPVAARLGLLVLVAAIAAAGWTGLSQLDIEARPDRLAAGLPAVADIERAERVIDTSGEVQVILSGPDVLTPEAFGWMRQAQEAVVLRHGDALRPIVGLPDLLRFLGPSPTQEQMTSGMALLPPYLAGAVVRADQRRAVLSFGLELQDLDAQRELLDGLSAALPEAPPGFEAVIVGLPVAAVQAYTLVSRDIYLTNTLGIVVAGLVLFVGLSRRSDAGRAVVAAVLATGWGLAGAWALGISLTPLTVALGSLTTVTACEFTVLLTERRRPDSLRLGRTVAVAALAAALGYAALAASGLAVLRQFGLLLSASVALSFIAAHAVVRLLPPTADTPPAPAREPGVPGTTRTEVPV